MARSLAQNQLYFQQRRKKHGAERPEPTGLEPQCFALFYRQCVTDYPMWSDDHNGSVDADSTIQSFGTNGSSSVALDGMGNSPDNKNRGIE